MDFPASHVSFRGGIHHGYVRRKLGALEVSLIDFKDRWIRPYRRRKGRTWSVFSGGTSYVFELVENRSFLRVVLREMIGEGIGLEMKGCFCAKHLSVAC